LKLQAVTSAYATATTPTTIRAETSNPIRGSTIRSATRLGGKAAFRFRRRNTIFWKRWRERDQPVPPLDHEIVKVR